jgi:hypothetical protein
MHYCTKIKLLYTIYIKCILEYARLIEIKQYIIVYSKCYLNTFMIKLIILNTIMIILNAI